MEQDLEDEMTTRVNMDKQLLELRKEVVTLLYTLIILGGDVYKEYIKYNEIIFIWNIN